jgi:hypothetical protein
LSFDFLVGGETDGWKIFRSGFVGIYAKVTLLDGIDELFDLYKIKPMLSIKKLQMNNLLT